MHAGRPSVTALFQGSYRKGLSSTSARASSFNFSSASHYFFMCCFVLLRQLQDLIACTGNTEELANPEDLITCTSYLIEDERFQWL